MGYLYFKVDEKAIKRKLDDILAKRADVQAKAYSIVSNIFNRIHSSLMREFLDHPITQELKMGNKAANISGTLNGEGNLFAFLGFYDGEDPTFELHELLQRISFHRTTQRKNVIYFTIDNIPTDAEITSKTRMTWSNASWAFGIESGDFKGGADLAHFMWKSWEGSRSKEGFQLPYEYSEEQFEPKPYITEILAHFREKVNNSKSKFLV